MAKVTILKFHAPWCATCKAQAVRVAQLAEHHQVELKEYNVEDNAAHAQVFGVRQLPTYVIMEHKGDGALEEQGRVYDVDQLQKILELQDDAD